MLTNVRQYEVQLDLESTNRHQSVQHIVRVATDDLLLIAAILAIGPMFRFADVH